MVTDSAGEGPAAPPAPSAQVVAEFFGARARVASAFAEHLATTAVERGLLGPREVPRLWSRHILNCAAVAPLVPRDARLVDVGSGAGLPGLVLAIARPDLQVTLVEPLLRRVTWLEDVTKDLDLTNATVVRARAEELPTGWADVATARAVAPLAKLTQWCLPLVKPGAVMLAIKGRSAPEELQDASPVLPTLGAASWRVLEVGREALEEPTTVVEVRKRADHAPGKRGRPRGRSGRRH